jgi:hypothetical protein
VRTSYPYLSSFSSSRVDEDWAPVWIVLPDGTDGVYSRKNVAHKLDVNEHRILWSMSMTEEKKVEESLREEFNALGKNIKNAFTGVWESEERTRISSHIEASLSEVGETISRAGADIRESETGKQVRDEIDGVAARIRTGELREKFERDLVSILRSVNTEIEKATEGLSKSETSDEDGSNEETVAGE